MLHVGFGTLYDLTSIGDLEIYSPGKRKTIVYVCV